jgi:hypothetical protein
MGSTPCTASVTRARSRDRAHGVHLRGLVAKIPAPAAGVSRSSDMPS